MNTLSEFNQIVTNICGALITCQALLEGTVASGTPSNLIQQPVTYVELSTWAQ